MYWPLRGHLIEVVVRSDLEGVYAVRLGEDAIDRTGREPSDLNAAVNCGTETQIEILSLETPVSHHRIFHTGAGSPAGAYLSCCGVDRNRCAIINYTGGIGRRNATNFGVQQDLIPGVACTNRVGIVPITERRARGRVAIADGGAFITAEPRRCRYPISFSKPNTNRDPGDCQFQPIVPPPMKLVPRL